MILSLEKEPIPYKRIRYKINLPLGNQHLGLLKRTSESPKFIALSNQNYLVKNKLKILLKIVH
jgi:hypothetical protein